MLYPFGDVFLFFLVFISSCFPWFRWLIAFVCFTVCVITASTTDLKGRFLLAGLFYLTLIPAGFEPSLGAGSSISKLAGLHADLSFKLQQSTKEVWW